MKPEDKKYDEQFLTAQQLAELVELEIFFSGQPEPDVPDALFGKIQNSIQAELENHHSKMRLRWASILAVAAILAIAVGLFLTQPEPETISVDNYAQSFNVGSLPVLYKTAIWQDNSSSRIDMIALSDISSLLLDNKDDLPKPISGQDDNYIIGMFVV